MLKIHRSKMHTLNNICPLLVTGIIKDITPVTNSGYRNFKYEGIYRVRSIYDFDNILDLNAVVLRI